MKRQRLLIGVLGVIALAYAGMTGFSAWRERANFQFFGEPLPEPNVEVVLAASSAPNPVPALPEAERVRTYRFSSKTPTPGASSIGFLAAKITRSHRGQVPAFAGTVHLVDENPVGSTVTVEIEMRSLLADTAGLTQHLQSPDFFDVSTFPTATFTSTSIQKADTGYLVTGNLDMHGVARSITFPADIHVEPEQVVVEAEFFIERHDWDIAYNGMRDDLIRNEVLMRIVLVAVPG